MKKSKFLKEFGITTLIHSAHSYEIDDGRNDEYPSWLVPREIRREVWGFLTLTVPTKAEVTPEGYSELLVLDKNGDWDGLLFQAGVYETIFMESIPQVPLNTWLIDDVILGVYFDE